MPRDKKCRRVCCIPSSIRFMPEDGKVDVVILTVEELESVRLCDLEGLDQDTAAKRMNVSRGTLQRIIYSAHTKVADALCSGKGIFISGGNYELAEHGCRGAVACSRCCFRNNGINKEQGDAE